MNNRKTKKLFVMTAVAIAAAAVWAGPHGCGPCGPGGHRPCAPRPCCHRPPAHHGGGWGRGGCNFWPGFIGGVVGGVVGNACVREVAPAPVVVTQPVVVQQPAVQTVVAQPACRTVSVWVEGQYVDTVQANGAVVRTWSPGHYEQRLVQ